VTSNPPQIDEIMSSHFSILHTTSHQNWPLISGGFTFPFFTCLCLLYMLRQEYLPSFARILYSIRVGLCEKTVFLFPSFISLSSPMECVDYRPAPFNLACLTATVPPLPHERAWDGGGGRGGVSEGRGKGGMRSDQSAV
jgi:hypothetical protein